MTTAQTYAWILYATALASTKEPRVIKEIEHAADAINHAVPTQKEMSESIRWLREKDLIEKSGKKLSLTSAGNALLGKIRSKPGNLMTAWKRITQELQKIGADNNQPVDCRTMRARQIG